ncbi:dihydrofolate reductase family protein [Streptococcus suis]|nr:dihydrofolate reductase family protein [Streptococcus suis]
MRKLGLNIAMSLDGFIARKDGSYDWIEGHGTNCYDTINQFDNRSFFSPVILLLWEENLWKIVH